VSLHATQAVLLRGDPGLFDIFKKVAGFAVGSIPGPVGTLGRHLFRNKPVALSAREKRLAAGRFTPEERAAGARLPPRPMISPMAFATSSPVAAGGGCPKGFHPNRSDYYTSAGFVAEGTKCVRNRRRNLSNGRANTRSLRRMAAWEKQDKKRRTVLKAIARSAG